MRKKLAPVVKVVGRSKVFHIEVRHLCLQQLFNGLFSLHSSPLQPGERKLRTNETCSDWAGLSWAEI